jgi:type IV pilus assembly protein PilE
MLNKSRGYSLLELVIVLVIIAILVAIAVPTYKSYITQSRRAEALQTLLAIQQAEEKYRISNTSYGNLTQVWNGVTTTNNGYYNLSVGSLTGSSYTITASATGSQSSDAEGSTSCSTLTLAYSNGTTTKTPTACWLSD